MRLSRSLEALWFVGRRPNELVGIEAHPQAIALSVGLKDVVERYAAEKYLLGELGENEAEEFEAHMFGCPACAEQVRLGVKLLSKAGEIWEGRYMAIT